MCQKNVDFQNHLKTVLGEYGIDFSVVKNFRGAPVQGYIFRRSDGVYQMVLTIRGAFADIFWFSLFHELGHIVNGDIGKSIKFIDDGSDVDKETAADLFARDRLCHRRVMQVLSKKETLHLKQSVVMHGLRM